MHTLASAEIQNQRLKQLENVSRRVRDSAERGDKQSTEYRSTLVAVNDKIILLSFGTASLLLTFLGVLFNSNRDTSKLSYYALFLSLACFLLSPALLMLGRWMTSVYLHYTVLGYYQQNLREQYRLQKLIYSNQAGPILNSETFELESEDSNKNAIYSIAEEIDKVGNAISESGRKEERYRKSSELAMISGYAVLIVAYIFAGTFMAGVAAIMKV